MYGYDAISANIGSIPANAIAVAGYVTGTPDIVWTQADFDKFPLAHKEYIDQGNGSPWRAPTVIDIENGALTVSDIPAYKSQYPDIIVYCMQSNLAAVANVFTGRVWLAAPSYPADDQAVSLAAELHKEYPGLDIIAIQNVWGNTFDRSIILEAPVVTPPNADHVNIQGWELARPSNGMVPVVIGWFGTEGVTYRQANLPQELWDQIKWSK